MTDDSVTRDPIEAAAHLAMTADDSAARALAEADAGSPVTTASNRC